MTNLKGKKIAILATDGFEQSELLEPKKALEEAGAEVKIVSLKSGEIKGWKDKNWADTVKVDLTLEETDVNEFDALHLPGGVINPDLLRTNEEAVNFVKEFVLANKPVSAICHAPWILITAGVVKGKTITSWQSVKTDLVNAGANWVDQEVVVDDLLVTSRKPADLPEFNQAIIKVFSSSRSMAEKGS
ncbi:MAG TPA: type 1 glutamine amidotransferase domain-containing protein [Pyrinomonadaceae bacterium]|nr:type 1 glutamine amidotransferase domain-containing protein [Pyrinomonadaceae bacterium]